MGYRAKGKYNGLVASVALETERITTQSQTEMFFKAPAQKMEVDAEKDSLPARKAKIVNDQGVVTLESNQMLGNDISSSESDIEMEKYVPPVVVKKRVHEEVGKIIKTKFHNGIKQNTFLNNYFFRHWRR